jgi:hypothetical protein
MYKKHGNVQPKPVVPNIPNTRQYFYPSSDAYVYAYSYRNWNRANRGKYDQLVAGWHAVGGESRIYLKFDLSGLKKKVVDKAVLRLYHFQTAGTGSLDLGIYRVTSRWKEGSDTYHPGRVEKRAVKGELSWMRQPTFDKHRFTSFNPGKGKGNWIDIDITPLVNQWLSGVPNHGLMIKPVRHQGTALSYFASRERESGLDVPKGKNKSPVLLIMSKNGLLHHRVQSAPSPVRKGLKSKQLYWEYMDAYNKLQKLMKEGKGDTPEAQTAYKAYKRAKDLYNNSTLKGGK